MTMARPPWILRLRNARDPLEQIASLRAIKNEVVGHPLKKEIAVTQGLLDPIVRLTARPQTRQDGKSHDHTFAARPLSEEEQVRLQGLHILASIAIGGPSFLPALHSVSALQAVLSNLCPTSNPAQIVLASLRTLSNMVSSAELDPTTYVSNASAVADALFVRQHLNSLTAILSQNPTAFVIQNQVNTAASLISNLCHEERHQQAIASSGVLDALATKLASFVVADGLVLPGAEALARRDGLLEHFPPPASPSANYTIILRAIAAIIADSKLRASQLLYSPSILAVFPSINTIDPPTTNQGKMAWTPITDYPSHARNSHSSPMDCLLPSLPSHNSRSAQSTSFPPLGASLSRDDLMSTSRSSVSRHNGDSTPVTDWFDSETPQNQPYLFSDKSMQSLVEEPESALVGYLIYTLRSRTGMGRLAAASVLAVLYRTGLTHKSREAAIGALVIPLLLDLLHNGVATTNAPDALADEESVIQNRIIREETPSVLAMLITDNEYLQKAAVDAHAIPRLCMMLKTAYSYVPDSLTPAPWNPSQAASDEVEKDAPLLGNLGLSPLLIHNVKVRESTLKAIASIVPFKDEYRKAVVDEGIIPFIVESVNSEPGKPTPKTNDKSEKPANSANDDEPRKGYGVNPVSVIIAACGAIRALSRSVSILRTTLIDNGIAAPVVTLLRHPDIEVQIAATATMCNLVTDISPMRDMIAQAGVVKVLCEHARSTNARLRLNAVWALKHFVNAVPNDMKRQCVEELGQGWLVQLICDDTEDEALSSSRERGEKSQASDDMDEDVEMDQFEEQVETAFNGSFGRTNTSRPSSSRSKSVRQAELRLAALRDAETNPQYRARKDDIAVQEQGLSFIRNLIGPTGPGASSEVTEMVDFLFNALGQDRVFEILASKLRPKVYNPYPRHTNTRTSVQLPQPEIVVAVTMILVHMAASVPRHRQIVVAQTGLLQLLSDQCHHPNIEVRLALCHLVTNLTWLDDQNDSKACSQRASALANLSFLERLEHLLQDAELNVRERAKSAVWQLKAGLGYPVDPANLRYTM